MPYGRSKAASQRFKTIIATVPLTGTVAIVMMEVPNNVSY